MAWVVGLISPMLLPSNSVNQRLPSGPVVMPSGQLLAGGTGNSVITWVVGIDVIRNKGYNSRMMTYATLQSDRREFLALTGLTLQEFQLLLNAFTPAYERRYPKDRTLADRPRQRCAGGGRKGVLDCPEQKLLFLLVYLKTYPLQVLMGELFGLSQPGVNYRKALF